MQRSSASSRPRFRRPITHLRWRSRPCPSRSAVSATSRCAASRGRGRARPIFWPPGAAATKPPRQRRSMSKPGKRKTSGRKASASKAALIAQRVNTSPRRRSAEDMLEELKGRLLEIDDLSAAGHLLSWDQATYMPQRGARARGRQGATLHRLAHERLVDPALGRLLDALAPHTERLPPDSDEACLIRVVRRDFEQAIKVPPDYVARANALGAASYDAWTRARPANDFATMRPLLEQTLELSREYAGYFAPYDHIADPLIDEVDEGATTASMRKLFSELRAELVPMVRAISAQPRTDDSCLHGSFEERAQLEFGLNVARKMGYDL